MRLVIGASRGKSPETLAGEIVDLGRSEFGHTPSTHLVVDFRSIPAGADRCSPARRASAGPERGPAPAVTRRRAGGTRSFREPPTYGSAPRRAACISPSSGSAQSRPAGGGPSAGHRHLIPDRVAIQYPLATKGILIAGRHLADGESGSATVTGAMVRPARGQTTRSLDTGAAYRSEPRNLGRMPHDWPD